MILTMFTFVVKAQITIFNEGFEEYSLPAGWTLLDADNDGNTWMHSSVYGDLMGGHTGEGAFVSYSYDTWTGDELSPDNWLVTPAISLTGSSTLTFWRMVGFFNPADHYGVYVSTTSATDPSTFTLLFEETPVSSGYAWTMQTVSLDNYTGNTVYIAFRHFNCTDQLLIAIDDITITSSTVQPTITVQPMSLQFPNVPVGTPSAAKQLQVSTYNITGGITANVAEPFEISVDNTTFGQTAMVSDADTALFVRYYPFFVGEDSTLLTLTNGTAYTEVYLFGNSVDCSSITLPYAQNFNDIPENAIPECWSQINPFDGYPKTTDDYTSPGDNVLMFKCDYNNSQPIYAVLPQMPEYLSNLQIQFNTFREGNNSGTLSVGYVTDPTDSSTFVPVWSINAAQIGDNNPHPYIVSFDNVEDAFSSNYYIAFKYAVTNNWYWFVDDIIVEEIPACGTPNTLTASQVTSTSATISWGGNADSYNLYYKTNVDTGWTLVPGVMLDEDGYTLEDLTPGTVYSWYVEAVCDDGSTIQSLTTSTFTTECAAITAPFTQNFDASSSLPLCWGSYTGLASNVFAGTALSPSTSGGWVFNNTNVFGLRHAKLNIYGTSCNKWLVTPAIDLTALTNPALTFDLALTGYNSTNPISNPTGQPDDKFMVIISTDNGATWSADNAIVWSNDSAGNYVFNQIPAAGQEITIPLTSYVGQTVMIAFYGESTVANGDNDLHIDNVTVDNLSNCPKPTNLTILSVTGDAMTLGWDESGSATAWNIEYGPSGFQHGSDNATLANTTSNPFTINNLNVMSYDFYVQSDCGTEQSNWVGPITATPGTYNIGTTGSDTLTTCSLIIYDNGGASGNYSPNCDFTLILYPETEGDVIAISGTYETESNWDFLRIYDGVGTNGTLLGDYCGTGTVPTLVSSAGPLTIKFTSDAGIQKSGFVLNTSCTSCAPAGNLTVSNVAAESADLTWTGSSSNYMIEYKAASDTSWNTDSTSDTTFSLSDLTPSTLYIVNVYGDCNGNYSPATSISFSTTMNATGLPYSTDFSSESDQNWVFFNGSCSNFWKIDSVNDNTSALFITNNGNTPGYNTNSFSVVSAEKLFTIGEAADLLISFDVKVGGEGIFDYLKVFFAPADSIYPATNTNAFYTTTGYSNFALDFSDYLQYSEGSASYPYKFNLTGGNTVQVSAIMPNPNIAPAANSTAKLVFLWKNDQTDGTQPGAIIYNVSIEEVSCPTPTELTVYNLTTYSADISWVQNGEESDWILEYKEVSDSVWTSVAISGVTSYPLNGLTAGTTYQVRVQADCGSGNQSLWVSTFFTVPCEAVTTFPYTEDFEHGGAMPDCWSQEYVYGMVNWTLENGTQNSSGIENAHSGSYNAFIYEASSNGSTTRLISPIFDLTNVTNPYLSYWYAQKPWGNDQDHLSVFYRTSPSSDWQMLTVYASAANEWTKDSLALPNPSATYQLAFSGNVSYGYGIVLDDITIAAGSDIPVITNPTVATTSATNISQTTATLNGAITNPDNVTITAKGFEWKATAGGTYAPVTVTGNNLTYNLSGLTANTDYTYKAFITYNGTTVYGSEMTFTTLEEVTEPCEAPTDLRETGEIIDKAIGYLFVEWDDHAGASQWNLQYKLSSENNWNTVVVNGTPTHTFEDLEAYSVYNLRVQAICEENNLSEWSNILTATAQGVGINDHLLNSITLYPNPANDVVNVECTMYNVQLEGIEVIDVYGKVVRTVVETLRATSLPTRINISGLAAGMYFVRVTTEEGEVTKTFVVKR